MKTKISHDMVGKWLNAWSLSRKLPLPVRYKSGFKVNVGEERQKIRYVFSELNDDFIELSEKIEDSWIYLKVCSSPDEVKNRVSDKWIVQPQGYMMYCFGPMKTSDANLCDGYHTEYEQYNSTTVVKIITENGEQASIGRVVLLDNLAVYDRIVTEEAHRRKGLAGFVVKELEKIALSKGISNNFLVATEQGKTVYEKMGWELYSLYTSIVIPEN